MSKKPATDNAYVLYQEATHRTVDLLQRVFLATLEENSEYSHKNFKKALTQKMKGGDATIDDKKLLAFLSSGEWDWRREIKEMSEGWLDTVDADDPYVEGGITLTEALGYEWSEQHYRKYAKVFSFSEYETLLYEQGESPALMGVVNGIHYGVQVLAEFQELLEAGKGIPQIYEHGSFTEANAAQIASVSEAVYQDLVGSLELLIDRGDVDANTIVTNDTKTFEAFLDPSVPMSDSSYVADRLDFTASNMESLSKRRNHVLLGRYKLAFLSYDQEQRVDYGILLGMQRYLEYLKSNGAKITTRSSEFDDRMILPPLVLDYIKDCLDQLSEEEPDVPKGGYLSEETILHIMRANFQGFGDKVPRKLFETDMDGDHLARYVGDMLKPLKERSRGGIAQQEIILFLQRNFKKFSELKPESVTRKTNSKAYKLSSRLSGYPAKRRKDLDRDLFSIQR